MCEEMTHQDIIDDWMDEYVDMQLTADELLAQLDKQEMEKLHTILTGE